MCKELKTRVLRIPPLDAEDLTSQQRGKTPSTKLEISLMISVDKQALLGCVFFTVFGFC